MTSKRSASTKSRKSRTAAADDDRSTCFVIMPFGDWFDDYYSTIFVPAIEGAGLNPRRADDLYRPSAIVGDIWELTKAATIILADLSDKNPNVFYELGLAHASAKPAILVTASMEDIPFDLRALRIIEYDKNDPYWGSNLRDQIEAALRETLESPLSAVLPSFLSQPDREIAKDVPERDQEIISLRQDLDLLKRETRSSSSRLTSREREISQSDAGILVAQLVESGVDDEVITRTLESQGAPLSWIRMRTRRARRALSPQREDVTSPSGED